MFFSVFFVEFGKILVVDLIYILVLKSDFDIIVYIRYVQKIQYYVFKKEGKEKVRFIMIICKLYIENNNYNLVYLRLKIILIVFRFIIK